MPANRIALIGALLTIGVLSACGGGSSGVSGSGGNVGGNHPPTPDFTLAVRPQSISLTPGGSESVNISVGGLNGFAGQVDITISGVPSGVTASTTSFVLSAGSQSPVEFSATSTDAYTTATVTVSGIASNINHQAQVPLAVALPGTGAHPPVRTRYIRTDLSYNPNSLQYAPPHLTVYDATDKRFFVSNPYLNRIDVFDSAQEIEIGQIAVQGPWGLDISPDNTKLYAGTLIGSVYQIDPVHMQVLNVTASAQIGPAGFPATEVFVLANGNLALLGGPGGLAVDGYEDFAIWNPTTNALKIVNSLEPAPAGCSIQNFGAFGVNGDRTKILAGSIDSDGTLCSFDVASQTGTTGSYGTAGNFVNEINATPDGKRFFATGFSGNVVEFDAATVKQLGAFQGPSLNGVSQGIYGATLSLDGATLYVVDRIGEIVAYDATSLVEKGWVQSYLINDLQSFIVPAAVDETGLIVGPIGHGVAFLDGSQVKSGQLPLVIQLSSVVPDAGPASGGTMVQAALNMPATVEKVSLGQAYVGNATLQNAKLITIGSSGQYAITGSAPATLTAGPADFLATFGDGGMSLSPEAFSYDPSIIEVVSNAATADGGANGAIVGYGLGQSVGDVQVMVGGRPAPVKELFTYAPVIPYPFPVETLVFTVPSGTVGPADIKVTTASGSTADAGAFRYAPVLTSYPLSGADLEQGIYDASRKVYYFADQSKIQVLSLGSGWQTPITLPGTGANTQLLSLSLSPNGSKLAISDYGDLRIYVLDPSSPGSVQSYAVKQPTVQGANSAPTGLCITDNGVIYYAVDYLGGSGGPTFEKLDTTTNTTTILGSGGGILTDVRVLLSPDGSRVYVDFQSLGFYLDTATDKITLSSGPGLGGGVPDFSMSADGTTLAADGFVVDSILNPTGIIEYVDRETWLPQATFGQKLNKDGSVLFQPLTDGIDVLDVQTGRLVNRVQLPIQLPSVYDSLVVDGQDALVAAITTSGVVTIDLSSVTPSHADVRHVLSRQEGASRPGGGAGAPQSKLAGTASILANRPSLKRATRAPAVKIPTRYR